MLSKNINNLDSNSQQDFILNILIDRFNYVPESISHEINQITNPLVLEQILQLAKVSSSLKDFKAIVKSNLEPRESLSTFNSMSLISADLGNTNTANNLANIDLLNTNNKLQLISQKIPEEEDNQSLSENEEKAKEEETEEALMALGALLAQLNAREAVQ